MSLKIVFNPFTGNFDYVNSSTPSSLTIETPSGDVDALNVTFTPTSEPIYVVADGITYFDGAGYTYVAPDIIMDVPPSQYIRDAI